MVNQKSSLKLLWVDYSPILTIELAVVIIVIIIIIIIIIIVIIIIVVMDRLQRDGENVDDDDDNDDDWWRRVCWIEQLYNEWNLDGLQLKDMQQRAVTVAKASEGFIASNITRSNNIRNLYSNWCSKVAIG